MNVFPNILAKSQNFKKLRHGFVDERPMITTTLIYSCQCKILVPFCLRMKRPKNAFLTLAVNYLDYSKSDFNESVDRRKDGNETRKTCTE